MTEEQLDKFAPKIVKVESKNDGESLKKSESALKSNPNEENISILDSGKQSGG